MSLVAYSLAPDEVEIITDSWAYTRDATDIIRVPKVIYYPRLDTALVGLGGRDISLSFMKWLIEAPSLRDVDDVAGAMVEVLPTLKGHENPESFVYAFGWSPATQRYVGYQALGGLDWMVLDALMGNEADPEADHIFKVWPEQRDNEGDLRPHEKPDSWPAWIELAESIRNLEIATPPERRTLMGGEVVYTRLDGGTCQQAVIHTFDDGEGTLQMLAGTGNIYVGNPAEFQFNDVGRNDACPCGSGKKYKHCHLAA